MISEIEPHKVINVTVEDPPVDQMLRLERVNIVCRVRKPLEPHPACKNAMLPSMFGCAALAVGSE